MRGASLKVDEAKPHIRHREVERRHGAGARRPDSNSRSRAERNWRSGFGPNSAVHAVRVADKLSYDGCRKAAIFVALLDPRDRETIWRRADQSMSPRLEM